MAMPKEGSIAPQFTLPDESGMTHSLRNHLGSWVFLYFYPRDNTPGCTVEAVSIRDNFTEFKKFGCDVFGVSADSQSSHLRFKEKQDLPFTLLSDERKVVLKRYGIWQKKKMAGREYMGIVRMSFLIDPAGKIARVYPSVVPKVHVTEVIHDLEALQ